MEVGCRIVLSSDAHSPFDVGNVENGIKMLEEINFPEEVVMNTSADRFIGYLRSVGKDIVL